MTMKKLLLAPSAVAMPIGLALLPGASPTASPKVDEAMRPITCTSVTGQAEFAPSLVLAGPLEPAETRTSSWPSVAAR